MDPSWLEVSPQSQYAAGDSRARSMSTSTIGEREYEALVSRERTISTWLATVAGAMGGPVMLLVANALLQRRGATFDPAAALGQRLHVPDVTPEIVGFGIAAIAGLMTGALLGRFTWRVNRVVPRVLFFAILMPILWLFSQVFIIGHFSRTPVSAFPAGPFFAGALAYGLLLAIIPALHTSRIREILPEKK